METINWREMPEFEGVDLEDSWILGWSYGAEEGGLILEMEASLWPGQPSYEQPRPSEYTCYKKARLAFIEAAVLGELPNPSEAGGTPDPDGSTDYGSIDVLELDGDLYHLVTDFADLRIQCQRLELWIVDERG